MVVKKKAESKTERWDRIKPAGTGRSEAEHYMVQAFVGQVDEIASQMERKWGIDRLPRLVAAEWAVKFYSQARKFNTAVYDGSVADVQVEGERMRAAWTYLDQLATAAGHDPVPSEWWEVEIGDGKVVAFCRSYDEARAASVVGDRKVDVWTTAEVAKIIAGFPTLATVKAHFPGAEVTAVRVKPKDPHFDWTRGDDVPFYGDGG